MTKIEEIICQRIKQARLEAGLTLVQLAEKLHVASNITIARYENGTRQISLSTLEQIAEATGKSLAWFLQDEDSATVANNDFVNIDAIYRSISPSSQQKLVNAAEYLNFTKRRYQEEPDGSIARKASNLRALDEDQSDTAKMQAKAEGRLIADDAEKYE